MKAIYVKTLALLVMVGMFGMSGMNSAQAAQSDDDGEARKLEGTWVVQVTLRDCGLGTPLGAPFLSLLTFARGGTETETTSNGSFFPAVRGPGHGVWSYTGHHTYHVQTMAFITLNGALTRTQVLAQTIEVESDDAFATTSSSVKFFAPDGTLLGTGCASATGKLLE